MGVGPHHRRPHELARHPARHPADRAADAAGTAGDPSSAIDAAPADADTERLDTEPADTEPADPSGSWPAPVGLTGLPRLMLADRQCSRSGCADRAEATLTYHYGQSQVWLDHLATEREPHSYDICARHAARRSVPHGWHLDDRRDRRASLIAV